MDDATQPDYAAMLDAALARLDGNPPARPHLRPVGAGEPPQHVHRLPVTVNSRHLNELAAELGGQLVARNDPPTLVVRAGRPTRIRTDENGRPIVETCDAEHLRVEATDVCSFHRINKDGAPSPATLPLEVMRAVLAARSWPFPSLLGITEAPILRPDGTFHTTPGYEPLTKLYHWTDETYPAIPALPSASQVSDAIQIVDDILADFPFDTPADRANAWGLILTPLVRSIIDGQVPMALLDAPEPGTGKGLLAQVYSTIAAGRNPAMQPLPTHDEELEKRITAMLIAGATVIVWDNVDGTIRSPVLAAALTADTWQGRVLGQSLTLEVPNRATWLATGNNIDVGGDLARRCYRIRLDARQARPWARDDFRHPDLLDYIQRNRVHILTALCTIVRHWWADGQPLAPAHRAMGGYTSWVRVIGGILAHAGIDGFLGNLDEFHATADTESAAWEGFLTAWHEHWTAGTNVTVADLVRAMEVSDSTLREALPDDLAGVWGDRRFNVRLGQQLRKRKLRVYGDAGYHIVLGTRTRDKTATFSVQVGRGSNSTPARGDALTCGNAETAGVAGVELPPYAGRNPDSSTALGDFNPCNPRNPRAPSEPMFDPTEEPF